MHELMRIQFNPNSHNIQRKTSVVVIASQLLKTSVNASVEPSQDVPEEREFHVWINSSAKEPIVCNTSSVLRLFARFDPQLYGQDLIQRTEVDNWLTIVDTGLRDTHLQSLQHIVAKSTHLVGDQLSFADICVWNQLNHNSGDLKTYPEIKRWLEVIDRQIKNFSPDKRSTGDSNKSSNTSSVKKSSANDKMTKSGKSGDQSTGQQKPQKSAPNKSGGDAKQEGKYIDLPDAVAGQVVVRFPPEASGYLHIGHAKAALLNQHYQKAYDGKLILRFDDTNPDKEKEDFEKVILEDVKMLQIKHDIFSYTSDHFPRIQDECEKLLRAGKAYVDDTAPEIMKTEREGRVESKNRNNSVDKNLKMWDEMKRGTELGQKCCVRAKLDMASDNGCLRDPAMYRCKNQPHPRTGTTYKVYPTYDFACPIVDSLEGVTHSLRTSEYLDRDAQFYWFIDAMGLRKPTIWAYSRLNMTNTVLSKRKLTFFADEGIVEGWDDPRMPTVRGVLRRGLTVEGLKQFIVAQGSSRSVVFMEWDKIWAYNKKVIDPIAARYSAVEKADSVVVDVSDAAPGSIEVALHPKNAELGKRQVRTGRQVLIDQTDAQQMSVGDSVTFINWGNLSIAGVTKDPKTGLVAKVSAKLNLDNKDFKKTLKVTWIETSATIPAILTYYEHIISKPVLKPDDDFKAFINRDTKFEVPALTDEALSGLKKGDIIQIQRKGFFICDSVYDESTRRLTGKPAPVILISIPDGSTDLNVFPKAVQEWKKKTLQLAQSADKAAPKAAGDVEKLLKDIKDCGDGVRQLKADKAAKDVITAKVNQLLALKTQFKTQTGVDWTPDVKLDQLKLKQSSAPSGGQSNDAQRLDGLVRAQGDLVRKLKGDKAAKDVITESVNKLLELKAEFKKVYGKDWTPDVKISQTNGTNPTPTANPAPTAGGAGSDAQRLDGLVRAQGDLVRKLKGDKAAKDVITESVNKLLELKAEFKKVYGKDWTPDIQITSQTSGNQPSAGSDAQRLDDLVQKQADTVRQLKADKADKAQVDESVKKLLELKVEYKKTTGADWVSKAAPAAGNAPKASGTTPKDSAKKPSSDKSNKKAENKPKKEAPTASSAGGDSKSGAKKQTRLGMETKKAENTADWYTEVITKAEMIEYYDVSGCYILRPWAYAIWETIQGWFDAQIKGLGVENCYFPMFISKAALETEKTHIADFAPEVAWVTKSGQSELAEPIAIRPTSETVMYPSYAKWVQSHRDLPIRLNQWCSVVRWEFKTPTPFLRTREFLWQEGHSAFASKEEALEEVYQILDFYAQVYEYLLAIPVIKGRKTEKEKFAGGDMTTTCEAYVGTNGRGIQGATSHFLGQNFSKMFDIVFEDPQEVGQKRYAYQNSWGLSTRSIGAVVMIHGDDKGLVLPPRVAKLQVVIVPCGITATTTDADKQKLMDGCRQLELQLRGAGMRVRCDLSDHYSPGWKFNHWELKGVPVRVEFGPKDMQKGEFVAVRRDTGAKSTHKLANAAGDCKTLLDQIHDNLYEKAKGERDSHLIVTRDWQQFLAKLDEKFIIMSPFCGGTDCEDQIKRDSAKEDVSDASGPLMGAKSLCIPLEQPQELTRDMVCIHPNCKAKPKYFTLFGRSY